MRKTVYLTLVASSVLCFGVLAHAEGHSVTLDLGKQLGMSVSPIVADAPLTERHDGAANNATAIIGDLAAGFRALAFRYASSAAARIDIYDGVDGAGNLVGSFALDATGSDPAHADWRQKGLELQRHARSFVIRTRPGTLRLAHVRFEQVPVDDEPAPGEHQPSGGEVLLIACAALLAAQRRGEGGQLRIKSAIVAGSSAPVPVRRAPVLVPAAGLHLAAGPARTPPLGLTLARPLLLPAAAPPGTPEPCDTMT